MTIFFLHPVNQDCYIISGEFLKVKLKNVWSLQPKNIILGSCKVFFWFLYSVAHMADYT